jgi:hypothetical protein
MVKYVLNLTSLLQQPVTAMWLTSWSYNREVIGSNLPTSITPNIFFRHLGIKYRLFVFKITQRIRVGEILSDSLNIAQHSRSLFQPSSTVSFCSLFRVSLLFFFIFALLANILQKLALHSVFSPCATFLLFTLSTKEE